MGAFRSALPPLAADLDKGLDAAQAQARGDAVIATLDQFTRDDILVEIGMDDPLTFRDVADLARGVGGYVFRETFAAFMQSATIAQGFERPRGHAEGRDFLEKVEHAEPEGDGRFGPLIDRWFLGRPLCQARRNIVRRVRAWLQQEATSTQGPGPVRLTSLSAGTCREISPLLASATRALYLTCIDADADDLTAAAESARQQNWADHVTFLEADLLEMIHGVGPISLGPQHVIYGLGVCDYFTDDQVKVLLDWAYDRLVAGGLVILTNRDAASPDRAFIEHILDWPVVHRTRDEFTSLFTQSKFHGLPVEMEPEASGVNLIARCRRA